MTDHDILKEIGTIARSLFAKNFFSVFHGSISARAGRASFIINTAQTILNQTDQESFIKVDFQKRDYRWHIASDDVHIHEQIYETISGAKYVSYTMPPYATAYAFNHAVVSPLDYYGKTKVGKVPVCDPKNFDDWMERAPYEIASFFKKTDTTLMLIRGFGLISYDRDITEMAKKLSIFENSCKLLVLSKEA